MDGETKKMNIRPAQNSDVEAICAFDQRVGEEESRRPFIRRSIENGCCYIAEEGAIMGYAVLEYSFFELGFIAMLYVHENFRRHGVGTALMEHIEGICTTEKLFTSTNLSNIPMQSLLMKLGYEESGIVHGLDEDDPELFYRKLLV